MDLVDMKEKFECKQEDIKYEDEEKELLGGEHGEFCELWKCQFKDKPAAVKILNSIEWEKAQNQLSILLNVSHPNIVKTLAYHYQEKRHKMYIVTELPERSLYQAIHLEPKFHYNITQAIRWCYQCATAIAYLHNSQPRAIIHRDIRPQNLLLFMEGSHLKLGGFGLARGIENSMSSAVGASSYVAPEVLKGTHYGTKSDLFSFAMTIYEIFERISPYKGCSNTEIRRRITENVMPEMTDETPKPIQEIVIRCWNNEPSLRPEMSTIESEFEILSEDITLKKDHVMSLYQDTSHNLGKLRKERYGYSIIQTQYFDTSQDTVFRMRNIAIYIEKGSLDEPGDITIGVFLQDGDKLLKADEVQQGFAVITSVVFVETRVHLKKPALLILPCHTTCVGNLKDIMIETSPTLDDTDYWIPTNRTFNIYNTRPLAVVEIEKDSNPNIIVRVKARPDDVEYNLFAVGQKKIQVKGGGKINNLVYVYFSTEDAQSEVSARAPDKELISNVATFLVKKKKEKFQINYKNSEWRSGEEFPLDMHYEWGKSHGSQPLIFFKDYEQRNMTQSSSLIMNLQIVGVRDKKRQLVARLGTEQYIVEEKYRGEVEASNVKTLMTKEFKGVIEDCRKDLRKNLTGVDIDNLLPYMPFIDTSATEMIKGQGTTASVIDKLLDHVSTGAVDQFKFFFRALRNTGKEAQATLLLQTLRKNGLHDYADELENENCVA